MSKRGKISSDRIDRIIYLLKLGMSWKYIQEDVGVSSSTVWRVSREIGDRRMGADKKQTKGNYYRDRFTDTCHSVTTSNSPRDRNDTLNDMLAILVDELNTASKNGDWSRVRELGEMCEQLTTLVTGGQDEQLCD